MSANGVRRDIELQRLKDKVRGADKKYRDLLRKTEELERHIGAFEKITPLRTHIIKPTNKRGGEATVVVLASDWHLEERVDPETVNGKNEYNLEVARRRAEDFFKNVLILTRICEKDVDINTMVLALLGDFISGNIHEELAETAQLEPTRAVLFAKNLIASGIGFLLQHSKLNLVIPCHSGNHARTGREQKHATEAGHSLEYMMYHYLADYFRAEPRVKFVIPRSYHSYIKVYDRVVRFHHGHDIRYGGGVGGLTIPVNKAINQWNKAEWADIDCFGHFHQRFDGGNFLCNGSLIGYNAYGISIKASFERPSQTLFLLDKLRGKTGVWPILPTV
jgi:hypothetical protein